MDIRVRFAPSPTGHLHIGGARTALVNWLFARTAGGRLILRVEDTDRERSTPEMTQGILDGLTWLGIDWDDGPFLQSERQALYRRNAEILLAAGNAYRCFCSVDELDRRRKESGEPSHWKYDGLCRGLNREVSDERAASGEPHVIRCAVPEGDVTWVDAVKGSITVAGREIDDFILLRSDGTPTYHLSVVSDDTDMAVSHVIRGEDHISNTPKQIVLYRGLGCEPPVFGHLPLILGPDRKKLSKRHGVTSVTAYRGEGLLSIAVFNILARLGTSIEDEACLSREEILDRFDLDALKRSASVFDRDKLEWLNAQAIHGSPPEALRAMLAPHLKELWEGAGDPPAPSDAALEVMRTRSKTLRELAETLLPFLTNDFPLDPKGVAKHLKDPVVPAAVDKLKAKFEVMKDEEWTPERLEEVVRGHAEESGLKAGPVIHVCRLFLTGRMQSPSIFDVLWAMGRQGTINRLKDGPGKAEASA